MGSKGSNLVCKKEKRGTHEMDTKDNSIFGNQSGAALVIAMIIMVVLTVVAFASSLTSMFEIKLSGNKRGLTNAFFVADAGVQVVTTSTANFSSASYVLVADTSTLPQSLRTEGIDSKPPTLYPSGFTVAPEVNIYHTKAVGAPRSTGFSATGNFDFSYFIVDSIGKDQLGSSSSIRSSCEVREKVVRLIPSSQGGN